MYNKIFILVVLIINYLTIYCQQEDPCINPKNKIIEENCKPGQSSEEWDVNGSGHPSILGFATDISKNKGSRIQFKIKTDSKNYKIDIYRLGYYNGKGARLQDTIEPKVELPQNQPECIREDDTWLVDCGNWEISAEWNIPYKAVSGLYIARPTRLDEPEQSNWRTDKSSKLYDQIHHVAGTDPYDAPKKDKHSYGALGMGELRNKLREPYASHIYFIVRDDFTKSDILLQTLDTTWQAYNGYGGYTTYGSFDYPYTHFPHSQPMNLTDPDHASKRAYKASLNRPLITRGYRDVNTPFSHEYPFIRFLEGNGYDVQYFTGLDADRRGYKIEQHKIYLSVGHDEYWSQAQRDIVEKARDNGVNLGFFSGNEVYWRIRWENSIVDNEPYRTMVCYKDTQSIVKLDPVDWTGTYRDNRDINPKGSQPENALTGTIFTVNAHRNDPLQVPYKYSQFRLWRNTDVAKLKQGETKTLIQGLLGHEWDSDIDNGYRPEGLIRLSETHIDNVQYVQDNGSVFDSATGTHHLVMYKKGESLVFGAGTVGWSWGLDNHHDSEYGINAQRANKYNTRVGVNLLGADKNIQQATINIFADMGVQPQNIYSHLVLSTKSTDKQKPELSITSLSFNNQILEVKGIGMDFGGGKIAGVEISFTEGKWHPSEVEFDGSFSFMWGQYEYQQIYDQVIKEFQYTCGQQQENIEIIIKARAIDDSCNIGPEQTQVLKIEQQQFVQNCQ